MQSWTNISYRASFVYPNLEVGASSVSLSKGEESDSIPGPTYEQCTEREGTTSCRTRIDGLRLWIGVSHQHPLIRKSLIDFSQIPTELRDLGQLRLLMSLRATF